MRGPDFEFTDRATSHLQLEARGSPRALGCSRCRDRAGCPPRCTAEAAHPEPSVCPPRNRGSGTRLRRRRTVVHSLTSGTGVASRTLEVNEEPYPSSATCSATVGPAPLRCANYTPSTVTLRQARTCTSSLIATHSTMYDMKSTCNRYCFFACTARCQLRPRHTPSPPCAPTTCNCRERVNGSR